MLLNAGHTRVHEIHKEYNTFVQQWMQINAIYKWVLKDNNSFGLPSFGLPSFVDAVRANPW